jgi:pyruvate/2-oxoglutarate dehydrogenase complex dihydrolipoamide dehydrogenase (E3) component
MARIMMEISGSSVFQLSSEEDLMERVHPTDWKNPEPRPVYDLVILGAGPAGLAAAEEATRVGLATALIERNRLGGNSLNVGSVPSKTLVRAAGAFAAVRDAHHFGARASERSPGDFDTVMSRMRRVRARIAEYHSAFRLRELGVDLFFADARFIGRNAIAAGNTTLSFKKALVATGARPGSHDIPGLADVGYFTSETIFDITTLPRRLTVIGGGPLGCELAQAFCRLGSQVTIVEDNPKFLPDEERDAAELVSMALSRDGVVVRLNTTVVGARMAADGKIVDTINNDVRDVIQTDEILLSVGRVADIDDLALDRAGVAATPTEGINVDDFLRTTNADVYAAGDVCLTRKYTNIAQASAKLAVGNAFREQGHELSHFNIPRCTYCDPEIAHIGMHAWDARKRSVPVKSFTVMMQDVDRAILDGQDDGFVKIHVRDGTDTILGATIVAARASEMINEISVIMSSGIGMRALAEILHTYPSQCDAIRLAALAFVRDG